MLVGTTIKIFLKNLKQATKMKHALSACIVISTLARYVVQLK